MKKILLFLSIFLLIFISGCGDKQASYSMIYRDQYNTGGDISFSYDNITHTAYFGGENEVIQCYNSDIAKGWKDDGCRVGVRIVAPIKLTNPLSGEATVGNEKFENGSFYKIINGELSNIAEFYPLVSQENSDVEIKIIWQDGIQEQIYKVHINEGTVFL